MATKDNENIASTLQEDVDNLKEDLMRIKNDFADVAASLKSRAGDKAQEARDAAQTRYNDGVESLEQYIEQRPLATVLMAFGVGIVLGKFLNLR